MQWSKIKNIVLLMLLAVDLLLLGQVLFLEAQTRRGQRQAREEAAALLAEEGIQVELSLLPEDPDLLPLRCERSTADEQAAAAAVLGPVELREDGSYSSDRGSLWFYSSGAFTAQFTPGARPLGERRVEAAAREVMAELGFQGEVLSITEEGSSATVRLRQCWEGVPIFSCEAEVSFADGCLLAIQGRRLPGTPVRSAGESAMTVTTALVRFLSGITDAGYVRSRIRSMTAGYEMTAAPASSTFRLTPIWEIETDASRFRLNDRGVLTQVSG